MKIKSTPLDGLFEIATTPRRDDRGQFTRLFCKSALDEVRPDLRFVQVNLSMTREAGTVRGLHYQVSPHAEAKLVRCLKGQVWDVAVDLRYASKTFGQWYGVELTGDNERQLFIPEGFAHGFQTLSANAEMLYQHTASHAAEGEVGILYSDASLDIKWPLPVTVISQRDRLLPAFDWLAARAAA